MDDGEDGLGWDRVDVYLSTFAKGNENTITRPPNTQTHKHTNTQTTTTTITTPSEQKQQQQQQQLLHQLPLVLFALDQLTSWAQQPLTTLFLLVLFVLFIYCV